SAMATLAMGAPPTSRRPGSAPVLPAAAPQPEETSAAATVQEAVPPRTAELSRSEFPGRPRGQVRRVWAVGAALGAALLGTLAWITLVHTGAGPTTPEATTAGTGAPEQGAAPTAPAQTSEPAPLEAPTPAAATAAPAVPSAAASAKPASASATSQPQPTAKRPTDKAKNPRCNPPYRMERGIRVPKPECF